MKTAALATAIVAALAAAPSAAHSADPCDHPPGAIGVGADGPLAKPYPPAPSRPRRPSSKPIDAPRGDLGRGVVAP